MPLRLSQNAITVLERRYLKRDKTGKVIETPEEMFRRVARAIAEADRLYQRQMKNVRGLKKNLQCDGLSAILCRILHA